METTHHYLQRTFATSHGDCALVVPRWHYRTRAACSATGSTCTTSVHARQLLKAASTARQDVLAVPGARCQRRGQLLKYPGRETDGGCPTVTTSLSRSSVQSASLSAGACARRSLACAHWRETRRIQ
eukprot:GHVU01166871.1.p2 GENE.GHVU01166871.1~~GHVU01166871.1.p2  ORF type:complete len:127 (+),score=1.95 GHVU01166871.1:86-466(+)